MLVFALFLPLVGGEGRAPPVVTEEQEEVVVVNTRTDVRLICPVRGHPTPLIEWSKVVSWCGVNLTLYKKQTFGVLLSLFLSHRKLCQFQLPQFPFGTRHDWWVYLFGWITKNKASKKLTLRKNNNHLYCFEYFGVPLLLELLLDKFKKCRYMLIVDGFAPTHAFAWGFEITCVHQKP